MKRLPHSALTRAKLSAAATGRKHTPETKAKIAEARRGRKHSPETLSKITEKRRTRTPQGTVEATKARNLIRRQAEALLRFKQRKADILTAYRLGRPDLMKDIKQSWGWWFNRKLHHPDVSDGFSGRHHKVMWQFPFLLELRKQYGY